MAVGLDSRMDQAWGLLMDRSTGSIAVCGKGGVGKTTLMRQLYTKLVGTNDFHCVIWVTVSSQLTLEKIQDDISKSIGLFDVKWVGKTFEEKAELMLNELGNKKFGLFLDDIWGRIDLTRLGVPNPQQQPNTTGCKLIFTTRSKDICREMSAQAILELEELSIEDAWQLFRNKVGIEILRDPRNSELATYLVHRCGGLPILLCTVGRAMSCRKTHEEWMYAVEEILRMEFEGMGADRFLHFCFNSLPHYRIKSCLIYFSLFPEDSTILKIDLIDFWICEQILGVKGPRGYTLSLGYDAIDTLIGAGLLEDEGECVKLLDMVRDCALKVAIKSQMFKNPQLLDPTDRETLETVGWISPMGNSIRNLANVPQNVFSFLLNHNPFIMIKGEFSEFVDALTVLDLSNSGVEEVPREISEFVSLQYLNLSRTWIEQLPSELMMLGKLKCLNLEYDDQLRVIPKQLITKLASLQVLKMFRCGFSVEEQEDNMLSVRNMDIDPLLSLEHLKVLSITITCDSALQKFFTSPKLSNCTQSLSLEVFWGSKSLDISPIAAMKNLLTLEIHQVELLKEINGSLHYSELPTEGCFKRLRKVSLGNCLSLQDLSWVILVPNLSVLMVKSCEEMEEIISDERIGEFTEGREDLEPFAKLEVLSLESLPKLESIYSKILPFPCLKKIEVIDCSVLRKLPLNSNCAKATEMIIEGEEEWWNDIEWEDNATKTTFVPCFKPLLFL